MKRTQFCYLPGILSMAAIALLLFSGNSFAQKQNCIINESISPEEWHFSGHLGQYIDKIAKQRITEEHNWNLIYPEAEEAFRLRQDDRDFPKKGDWRGEFWGKYILSAIAACRYYHSDELKTRIAQAVKGLLSTQDANGYIGTYSHSDFLPGNNWNVWCRKYTLWGLVESWELLKDPAILSAAARFADHLISEVGPGKTDIVKTGNFYGLPSCSILLPMVKLYQATGQKKYLEYAEYIVKQWSSQENGVPDILNKGLKGTAVHSWFPSTDPWQWGKGYEFTSCVEGMVELYKVTGEKQYLTAVVNIHEALVKWERTPVGSVSFNDKYAGAAGLINTLSEICDAVYWNRLSFQLFKLTGEEKYIGEIERTLYNALLCAYNEDGTWGLRRLRMSHVHIPAPNHFLQHHQCCVDNLPRALFQASEAELTSGKDNIRLSLFEEGEGSATLPSGQKIHVRIQGDFLSNQGIQTVLSMAQPEQFKFTIRHPDWCENMVIRVNGVEQKFNHSGRWVDIIRKWKDGDEVRIQFGLKLRWEFFDTTKFNPQYHPIDFYVNEWAKFKFAGATNDTLIQHYKHIESLTVNDALPQKPAVTLFWGPVALARDTRITGKDVFSPIKLREISSIRPIPSIKGIWKEYEVRSGNKRIKFCDFSSAGNTWNKESLFNTWCILEN